MANKSAIKEKGNEEGGTIEKIDEEIRKTVENSGEALTKKQKEGLVQVLRKVFIDGELPGAAMGFDEDFIKQLYNLAYNRYNLGLYKDADMMFRLLSMLDPTSATFRLGLAATNHRLKNYEVAIMFYFSVLNCNPHDPSPLFYCYDCYMSLDDPFGAYYALTLATKMCEGHPEYKQLQERCQRMMEALEERFDLFKKKTSESATSASDKTSGSGQKK